MKKIQTIVDRECLDSDYIESKQDFSIVLSQVKQLPTTWKNPWFYGPIGMAVFAVTISVVSLNPSNAKVVKSETNSSGIKQRKVSEVAKLVVNEENQTIDKQTRYEKIPSIVTEIIKEKEEIVQVNISDTEIPIEVIKTSIEPQIETIKQSVTKRVDFSKYKYPHIEGTFTGEIKMSSLFSTTGIQLNSSVRIISFDLNFFDGKSNVVKQIEGNVLPESLRSTIVDYNIGQMIFITNIKAMDEKSRLFTLPSINVKPIKDNEFN